MFQGKNRNDDWEDTLLRATILYNATKKDQKGNQLIPKAIYAIVAQGSSLTAKDIAVSLNKRFKLNYSDSEIGKHLKDLKNDGLLTVEGDRYKVATGSGNGSEFYKNLEKDTDALIDRIVADALKMGNLCIHDSEKAKMMKNTKEALSTYFHHFGFAYVGIKKNATEPQIMGAVEVAKKDLSTDLADRLIGSLYQMISEPPLEFKETLEQWARAFVTLEVLNLDPALRQFRHTQLRNKTFVIDTDVVLLSLASHAKYSGDFRFVLETLRKDGCKIVLPEKVKDEVEIHIRNARPKYRQIQPIIKTATDEILANTNVFVEDYAKLIREEENKDLNFKNYLRQFYDSEYPQILNGNLSKILGTGFTEWKNDELPQLDGDEEHAFADEIKRLTEQSEKGGRRADEMNEDLSATDAQLYIKVRKMNSSPDPEEALSGGCYLLTKSFKINKAARKIWPQDKVSSYICNPIALLSILNEIGHVEGSDISYINLFENPFLVYTAERIKDQIKPILEKGKGIKHDNLERMRVDSQIDLNRMLVGDTSEARKTINELRDRGYEMGEDNLALIAAGTATEKELKETKDENERLKAKIARMQKEQRFREQLKKLKSKKKSNSSNSQAKKSKKKHKR